MFNLAVSVLLAFEGVRPFADKGIPRRTDTQKPPFYFDSSEVNTLSIAKRSFSNCQADPGSTYRFERISPLHGKHKACFTRPK